MKRSLFILATLAMSSALYAADPGPYTRETVLDIFAQYNPSVLENAQQNKDYNDILESFVSAYQAPQTPAGRYELIAVARNFDASIRLQGLTQTYEDALLYARLSGGTADAAEEHFRRELLPLYAHIWAVTVQLREYELQETEAQLKQTKKDKSLSDPERTQRVEQLRGRADELEQELRNLQKDPGTQLLDAVGAYIAHINSQFADEQAALAQAAQNSQTAAEQTRQTANLQIKTKNKKPVAK